MARVAVSGRVAIATRQNLLVQAEDLSSGSWSKANVSIVANAIAAPDGTLTADFVQEDVTVGTAQQVSQTAGGTVGFGLPARPNVTLSLFARAATREWLVFLGSGGSRVAWVNFSTNTVGTISSGCSAACEAASLWIPGADAAWRRLWFTFDVLDNGVPHFCAWRLSTGDGVATYNGDGASGAYFWGAQFVQANRPGFYAATAGAVVNTGPIRNTP